MTEVSTGSGSGLEATISVTGNVYGLDDAHRQQLEAQVADALNQILSPGTPSPQAFHLDSITVTVSGTTPV